MNGGIEAVVDAMTEHLAIPGVQQFGCWALRNLAENAENRVSISSLGGLECVKEAFSLHPDRAEVVLQAAWATARLARNAANRVALCNDTTLHIETYISAGMSAHPHYADLQRRCCQAIATLCFDDANQVKTAKVDAIELSIAALGLHPESIVVAQAALWALAWLNTNADNQVHTATLTLTLTLIGQPGPHRQCRGHPCYPGGWGAPLRRCDRAAQHVLGCAKPGHQRCEPAGPAGARRGPPGGGGHGPAPRAAQPASPCVLGLRHPGHHRGRTDPAGRGGGHQGRYQGTAPPCAGAPTTLTPKQHVQHCEPHPNNAAL